MATTVVEPISRPGRSCRDGETVCPCELDTTPSLVKERRSVTKHDECGKVLRNRRLDSPDPNSSSLPIGGQDTVRPLRQHQTSFTASGTHLTNSVRCAALAPSACQPIAIPHFFVSGMNIREAFRVRDENRNAASVSAQRHPCRASEKGCPHREPGRGVARAGVSQNDHERFDE